MSEMANTDPEGIDGVRMTWNVWPRTKVEASKCVIPLAACIAPIRFHTDIPTLPYAPLRCKTCSAVLNAFSRVDFNAKIWICPFCYQRNHFPPHYSMISETNLPGELYPQYTTVQYSLPPDSTPHSLPAPVFVFVLDTCMIEEEMGYVKSALKQAIGLLPENALVGFTGTRKEGPAGTSPSGHIMAAHLHHSLRLVVAVTCMFTAWSFVYRGEIIAAGKS